MMRIRDRPGGGMKLQRPPERKYAQTASWAWQDDFRAPVLVPSRKAAMGWRRAPRAVAYQHAQVSNNMPVSPLGEQLPEKAG